MRCVKKVFLETVFLWRGLSLLSLGMFIAYLKREKKHAFAGNSRRQESLRVYIYLRAVLYASRLIMTVNINTNSISKCEICIFDLNVMSV